MSINFCPSLWENLVSFRVIANTPLASLSFLDIFLQSSDSAVSIPASETSVSNSRLSRTKEVDLIFSYFLFLFYFIFDSFILFLELGLGLE